MNTDSKGRFISGNTGKPKGTKNKRNCLVEALAFYLVDGGYEKFKIEFNKLEGKDFVDSYVLLTKFSLKKDTEIQANKYVLEKFNKVVNKKQSK